MPSRSIDFAGGRVEHAVLPPHRAGFTSTSAALSIGISFSAHRRAAIQEGDGSPAERSFGPGTIGVTGGEPVTWLRTEEPTESVELFPSAAMVGSVVAGQRDGWPEVGSFRQFDPDPRLWTAFVRLRAAAGVRPLSAVELESLAHVVVARAAIALGVLAVELPPTPLSDAQIWNVADLVHARLTAPPTLAEMAAAAYLSPYHFLRSFKLSTGLTPHQYVTAVRTERARRLLASGGRRVQDVAAALGYEDTRHFRRSFRATFGESPGSARSSRG